MDYKPIARCKANGVEAYQFPCYVKAEAGMEPDYVFLEDHLYTSKSKEKKEPIHYLFGIDKEQGLQDFGYKKDSQGHALQKPEKPCLRGGTS